MGGSDSTSIATGSAGTLNWGILGSGAIAKAFAKGLAKSQTGRLVAVGSRSQASADKFADQFNVARRHASYESLLADPDVQAVYISTPHPQHAEWAIRAAEAKKHILCEKPIGVNYAEAMAIIDAARRNDVFLMEAYMYRCHPQTKKLLELLRERAVGDVRVIHATFSFHWPIKFDPDQRLLSHAMAGGGILDVGGYCTSGARLVAGAASGKPFDEPIDVCGAAHLGTTGVDEWAVASLKFPGGVLAQLATGVQVNQGEGLWVYGSEGSIHVPDPWSPSRDGGRTTITVRHRSEKTPREVVIDTPHMLYAIEADTVAGHVAAGRRQAAEMSWDDTLGNMQALDRWRKAVGLTYEFERLPNLHPVAKRPVRVREQPVPGDTAMRYGRIPGVEKPVARLGVGADFAGDRPRDAMVIFDEYFERGGNLFDTAYVYARGASDKALGHWANSRGVREQVVLLGKGAHTPHCNPADLTKQLHASLGNLGTDYLDLYMLHRDNPDVPVGEFVDVLNEHLRAGRIKAFGGSNWRLDRVQAANDYARANGLTGFAAVSNNFSLARMVDAPWPGCVASSDPQARAWLTETQTTLVPWSSQARGFFTPLAAPDRKDDPELARCWYSDDNFQRKARAEELAARRGVEPIRVALAYVLHQPFPTFPLIGPRSIMELHSSLQALDIELSADELKWLNLEA